MPHSLARRSFRRAVRALLLSGGLAGAVAAGVRMINDVTALRHDPESFALVSSQEVPVVL